MNSYCCIYCKENIIITNKNQIYNDIINDNNNNKVEPNNKCTSKKCSLCCKQYYICNTHYFIKKNIKNCKNCHDPNCYKNKNSPIYYHYYRVNQNDNGCKIVIDYCLECVYFYTNLCFNEIKVNELSKYLRE
jgi:hypothetical protein